MALKLHSCFLCPTPLGETKEGKWNLETLKYILDQLSLCAEHKKKVIESIETLEKK